MSGVRAARAGVRGGRRLVGALGRRLGDDAARLTDDAVEAGARSGDEGASAARWWATRGAGAAGVAGAGGLAWRQQDVMKKRAAAREEEAQAEQLNGLREEERQALIEQWGSNTANNGDGDGTDVKGFLENLRDSIPGVETIQDTIVLLVVLAIALHFLMNRSNALPNSPVVIAGGGR